MKSEAILGRLSRQWLGKQAKVERGITLLELMVAMVIMAMVSAMLYSVLNFGMSFSRKGEGRAREAGKEHAFLELLHRQVHGAYFDRKQKKVLISTAANELRVVTNAPLLNRDLGIVLAVYLYVPGEDVLYYQEKKDYYNPVYFDDSYHFKSREMRPLIKGLGTLNMMYLLKKGQLKVDFRGQEYLMTLRCWLPEGV